MYLELAHIQMQPRWGLHQLKQTKCKVVSPTTENRFLAIVCVCVCSSQQIHRYRYSDRYRYRYNDRYCRCEKEY